VDVTALRAAPPSNERRTVYDVEHKGGTTLPGQKVRGEGAPATDDEAVNDAYDGADQVYDFFNDVFGRDSIDGKGMDLVSSVHYGVGFDNAFWDGQQMVYGDGSGHLFVVGALTKAVDVIGHEMAHGVTQHTAGLEYGGQPGALNESFSDVFGSLVKQYGLRQSAAEANWLIGEGSLAPQMGQALRSMRDPGTAFKGDPQPGHMDQYVDLPNDNDPRNDNGGVHINSGIPNRAFYLAATEIGGQAWEKAGRIWYAALTERLRPDSDFMAAAEATIEVAGELFKDGGEQKVVRGGGLAGTVVKTELASDDLSPEDAGKLHELVRGAGLLEEGKSKPSSSSLPDEPSYALTVEHGGRSRSVNLSESTMPEAVRSLISWSGSVPGAKTEVGRPSSPGAS
jgi:Zn-dependent metalloprotease